MDNNMIENEQENTIDTCDVEGGWIITHHTKTWDTRARLDSVTNTLEERRQLLDAAQKAYDEERLKVEAFKVQIEQAVNTLKAPVIE